ncbi:hypothetical protein ILUMI_26036 [Ignelater luminosus]|uniref:Uncharacterized protein n=1 Tax=Ignelater luminosus TaxID=2038154 RepID=A0A8K0FXJ5_IGNLU|nr:hypothetical protein ILUMI_26036 [Ignelater luminosus]
MFSLIFRFCFTIYMITFEGFGSISKDSGKTYYYRGTCEGGTQVRLIASGCQCHEEKAYSIMCKVTRPDCYPECYDKNTEEEVCLIKPGIKDPIPTFGAKSCRQKGK